MNKANKLIELFNAAINNNHTDVVTIINELEAMKVSNALINKIRVLARPENSIDNILLTINEISK